METASHPIIVIAEHSGDRLSPITWEGVGLALAIRDFQPGPIKVLILGDDVETLGKEIALESGLDVMALKVPGLTHFHGEAFTTVLEKGLLPLQPSFVLAGHTSQGYDYAPRLAVRLKMACITNVSGLRWGEDRLCFLRPLLGGKVMAEVVSEESGTLITLQPGFFKKPRLDPASPGRLEVRETPYPDCASRVLGLEPGEGGNESLVRAEVIVAAGRGIGKPENLELIQDLAALFPRSAVAGSRPLCDLGWMKYKQQVGLTGATVSPKLYLACGISGAYQHIAGMKDSGFIVAINRDPGAAIFNWSDLVVVEDLESFIPLLIEAIQKRREASS
jgi:electron transfer flavoprotein alpha subunit